MDFYVKKCLYYGRTCILFTCVDQSKRCMDIDYLWVMSTSIAISWFASNWEKSFLVVQTLLNHSVHWEKGRFWVIPRFYYINHSISLSFMWTFKRLNFPTSHSPWSLQCLVYGLLISQSHVFLAKYYSMNISIIQILVLRNWYGICLTHKNHSFVSHKTTPKCTGASFEYYTCGMLFCSWILNILCFAWWQCWFEAREENMPWWFCINMHRNVRSNNNTV